MNVLPKYSVNLYTLFLLVKRVLGPAVLVVVKVRAGVLFTSGYGAWCAYFTESGTFHHIEDTCPADDRHQTCVNISYQ